MINKVLKNILFKRSQNYVAHPELEIEWHKEKLAHQFKKICILSKYIDDSDKPCVILAHPYLSEAKLFFIKNGHAQLYEELGFSVVLFDFNGFGESPFVDFKFEEDIQIVAQYIQAKNPSKKIIIHGVSFGASHTITYSTLKNNIAHKIIIENCLDSNISYYKARNKKLYYLTKILMLIYPQGNKNHNYVKSIQKVLNVSSALLIYNKNDTLTTLEMGQKLSQACNIPHSFEIFEGIHLKALHEEPQRYSETIKTFAKTHT